MSKVKFELNREGVRELLRGKEMQDVVNGYAKDALQRLGDGYEMTTHVGKNRCNAAVEASSAMAKKQNAKENTILKAVKG